MKLKERVKRIEERLNYKVPAHRVSVELYDTSKFFLGSFTIELSTIIHLLLEHLGVEVKDNQQSYTLEKKRAYKKEK